MRRVGTVVALVLLAGLTPIAYQLGTGRLLARWTDSTWGVGLAVALVWLPWFVVLRLVGGDDGLAIPAMAVLTGAWAVGYSVIVYRFTRSRRGTSNPDSD